MKTFRTLLLALVMMCTCFATALADELDLTTVRENPNLYTFDVEVESDAAFVETTLSTAIRSFTHKYESTKRYSCTQFDILIVDYLQEDRYPVWRLWVTYCADDAFLNIDSVSFLVGGQKFTFSGVADTEWYTKDEDGYVEKVLIKFNDENLDFPIALEKAVKGHTGTVEELDQVEVKMILHGRENIEVSLGSGFLLDFIGLKSAFLDMNGMGYMGEVYGTTMKVTDVE